MTPQEARDRLHRGERITFVDARNPTAFAEATEQIPGAKRIPADMVDERSHVLPRGQTTVAYCT